MEVIKTLPDIFEEFSEQRRNSFLHAYEIKQKNIPFVGTFCTYTPTEVIMAAGAIPVGLCSFSDETIPEAEQDLPRNLCPLVKSSYGFAKTQKCPFFYFSDLIIGETTCDGKKKMYEMLGEIKDTYIMELPNRQSPMGRKLWREEVVALKNKLEEKFGVEITEEKLGILRDADAIFREEIAAAGLQKSVGQYFAVLTPLRSVGVMGDERTYDYTLALRAVQSQDFMTATWSRLPYELLDKVSGRIVGEVKHINRICYDITSKPPATVEWE